MNWQALFEVPGTEWHDARRRRTLNYILALVLFLCVPLFLVSTSVLLFASHNEDVDIAGNQLIAAGSIVMMLGVLLIYGINRYVSGEVAGWMFILLLIAIATFGDTPEEVVSGRSTFIFTIPILISSAVLPPRSSFISALLCSVAITALTGVNEHFNITAVSGFMVLAFVAWFSASSLENALRDLRIINKELDDRVHQRTEELSVALHDVRSESRKNVAILESIADGVAVFDTNGKVEVINNAFTDLFEMTSDEAIGKDVATITLNNIANFEQLNEKKKIDNLKFDVNGKTIAASVAPVEIAPHEAQGVVTVFHDFTREEQLNRMKDAFVSMASHELRTPLNAIIGFSDMLMSGVYGELSHEQRHITDRVMANSKRMLSLVNNLLDQAQFAEGKLVLKPATFEIKNLAKETEDVLSVLADAKGLEFNCTIEDGFPKTLFEDRERLLQILINLGGNAIKFTDSGSVNINFQTVNDAKWRFTVQDTGKGISKADQQRIFEPFQQVGDIYTREHGGTGLGLSIVRVLVELMGGEISVDSKLGEGSTFNITLPLQSQKQGK